MTDLGQIIASILIGDNSTSSSTAIIGRLNFHSMASSMACIMMGNPILCLDCQNIFSFDQMNDIEVVNAIVDLSVLKCDLDLSQFKSIKKVYTIGKSSFVVKVPSGLELVRLDGEKTRKLI